MAKIIGVKTFSAKAAENLDEDVLGKKVTKWLQTNPFCVVEDRVVVQSDQYLSIVLFYGGQEGGGDPLARL